MAQKLFSATSAFLPAPEFKYKSNRIVAKGVQVASVCPDEHLALKFRERVSENERK